MNKNKKGFTLVELLVVIIIVGVLAAVAVPLMTANVQKARKSEGMAGAGTIRTAQRLYNVENGAYATSLTALNTYVSTADLTGTWFVAANYTTDGTNIYVTCPTNAGGTTINMGIVSGAYNGY